MRRGGNRRPQTFRDCMNCSNRFGPLSHLKKKFCSQRCAYDFRKGKPSPKKGKKYPHLQRARIGKCIVCRKQYRAVNDHKKRIQKFCRRECFWIYWKKKVRPKIKVPGGKVGEENPEWKGDDVGYSGLHKWVARHLGKPERCEHCGTEDAKRFEWCNVDHLYQRVKEDWMRLCTSCHRRYDNQWN